MTEKDYGGATFYGNKETSKIKNIDASNISINEKTKRKNQSEDEKDFDIQKLKKAGEIAKQVKDFARLLIKPGMPLLKIAEKIERKIIELGGKPAFPVNLSINEIAAHSTPSYDDNEVARGLLKIDIGVHIDGFVADTAFSLDLENIKENQRLIQAAELARDNAIKAINLGMKLNEIGKEIQKTILAFGFQPITNLSGHSIKRYDLHSGITIPNHNNSQEKRIEEGVYAIEPFSTTGLGEVIEGKPSGIYVIENFGIVRDSFTREVLFYTKEEFSTLPFCSRWLVKKFGTRALVALKRAEEAKILHHYPQLIEMSRKKVAQAEHTIILTKKEKIITT